MSIEREESGGGRETSCIEKTKRASFAQKNMSENFFSGCLKTWSDFYEKKVSEITSNCPSSKTSWFFVPFDSGEREERDRGWEARSTVKPKRHSFSQ